MYKSKKLKDFACKHADALDRHVMSTKQNYSEYMTDYANGHLHCRKIDGAEVSEEALIGLIELVRKSTSADEAIELIKKSGTTKLHFFDFFFNGKLACETLNEFKALYFMSNIAHDICGDKLELSYYKFKALAEIFTTKYDSGNFSFDVLTPNRPEAVDRFIDFIEELKLID